MLYHRYIPAVDESVIAIITERYGDSWNTDINGTYGATLPALAFEGAVKHRAFDAAACSKCIMQSLH